MSYSFCQGVTWNASPDNQNHTQASSSTAPNYTTIAVDPRTFASTAARFHQSSLDTAAFVVGVWNAIGSWQEALEPSPVGAIYKALIEGQAVVGTPDNYYIPNVLNAGSFGNLLNENSWVAVETQAKQYWLNSIKSTLDTSTYNLINALTVSYLTTAGMVKPLTPPTLSPITPPADGDLNSSLNNGGLGDLNGLGDGLNDLGGGLGDLGNGLGDGLNSLGGGQLHDELEKALADNSMVQAALRSALAGDTPAVTALEMALKDDGNVRSLLNKALASGQVPKTGPLHDALEAPTSIGRDFYDLDEDTDYDGFAEPTAASRRAQYRQGAQ